MLIRYGEALRPQWRKRGESVFRNSDASKSLPELSLRISPIVIARFTHHDRSAATGLGGFSVLGFGLSSGITFEFTFIRRVDPSIPNSVAIVGSPM